MSVFVCAYYKEIRKIGRCLQKVKEKLLKKLRIGEEGEER